MFSEDELAELQADMADLVLTDSCVIQSDPHKAAGADRTAYNESSTVACKLSAERNAPTLLDTKGPTPPQMWRVQLPPSAQVKAANGGKLPRSANRIRMIGSGRIFKIVSYTNRESDDVLTLARCTEETELPA